MFDLSKLTPAPWATNEDLAILGPDGTALCSCSCNYGRPTDDANAAFISLARNAFDVLMRRKTWRVYWDWQFNCFCVEDFQGKPCERDEWLAARWQDPFTALVEADKWLTEQEKGATHGAQTNG